MNGNWHNKLFGTWQTTGRCFVWKIKDQAATRKKRKGKRREIYTVENIK
jgi:hypothetical protein